jgi:hypothetical protein
MLLLLATAFAAEPPPAIASEVFLPRPFLGRPVVDVRGGWQADGNATICAEASPLVFVSLDACGTGSGWFHQRPTTEMSHYRVEANLPLARTGRFEALLQPGVGLAEVQRDGDAPGFRFERTAGPQQTEAAGPEATLSVRGRGWFHHRAYASVEINAAVAHIPAAPQAVGSPSSTVPSAALTVGLGL